MFNGFFKENSEDISKIQVLLDPLLFTFSFNYFYRNQFDALNQSILFSFFIFFLTYTLLSVGELYKSYRNKNLFQIFFTIFKIWIFFTLILFIFSKFFLINLVVNLFNWSLICLLILLINHVGVIFLLRFFRRKGRNSRNILFWGSSSHFENLTNELSQNKWIGLKIEVWFSKDELDPNETFLGIRPFGGIRELKEWLSQNQIDYIIFSEEDPQVIKELLNIFGNTSSPVSFLPPWDNFYINYKKYNLGSKTLLEIWGDNKSFLDLKFKRLFDIVFSILLLIFLSPVFIFVSLVLLFDKSGPIFYLQDRYGLNGEKFKMYKFRSLKVLDPGDLKGLRHVSENDDRVTDFGKIIRRWSIDELPQLLNVLKGEMSLVGPRPHAVEHNEYYRKILPGYMQRHSTKPGMTGLAQIKGYRGDIKHLDDMENRIKADLKYVESWSIYLDLKILLRTFISLKGI
ncbi:Undecaprenyl-phosphate galactosephosphotransferase [Prochlorococcus marinus str. MIT 9321]|uniref:Undecaprenyl-phosphate galactosephosphotransferase n=1 Tax=Prochlorococcus marinus str. MIT 9401 TaxID=167551 RepID=A0A0A2BCQ0_PROMR|nr:exopolysaccharide biosynthesis polyprenyl glycosylphosphotransferase [Prochlorococcus marinus]KGG02863.1 Undecaprenyl-phosphate galactosephosphotransferase [Prochlorococcus marinus str. MIT 9321]KGG05486.1 Undecaprenyl-phosphate galactosephosphotransferase [Prochlorococcus marinus str. MIT 9322]KGG10520.1 Undecaprenyl-phosphate galactosephosphotransferase [Prochlorococcus marinus str. MIT 9401]